ncbi:MAG: hypothetical protein IJ555_15110 [Ruminococcus sp.]|nr:hypothetical protein [Ruminococcus sp.]
MTKDMTKGSPLKNILSFALPMTAGSIFQQLYNMVDSIIVGQYVGVKAFSAVGLLGSVCFLVIGTAIGMCSGFSIPIAQRFGAEDYKGMRKTVFNAAGLAGAIALVLTLLTVIFARPHAEGHEHTGRPDELCLQLYYHHLYGYTNNHFLQYALRYPQGFRGQQDAAEISAHLFRTECRPGPYADNSV